MPPATLPNTSWTARDTARPKTLMTAMRLVTSMSRLPATMRAVSRYSRPFSPLRIYRFIRSSMPPDRPSSFPATPSSSRAAARHTSSSARADRARPTVSLPHPACIHPSRTEEASPAPALSKKAEASTGFSIICRSFPDFQVCRLYTKIPYFPPVEKPNFRLEHVEDFWQKYPAIFGVLHKLSKNRAVALFFFVMIV